MEIEIKTFAKTKVELPESKFLHHLSTFYRINQDGTVLEVWDYPLNHIESLGLIPRIELRLSDHAFGYFSEKQISEIKVISEDEFNNALHRVFNTVIAE
jgi:hypothetical protein